MNTSFDHKDTPKNQRHSQHESQSAKTHPSRTIVHAKLEMTEPGDHDEQEADAIANAVVSGGKISRKISGGGGSSGIAVSQQMESQLSQLQGGGRQMPEGLRNMMESGFGRDFSQVRLHTDSEAASMSSSIHAKAFTLGNDIYFNRGQFSPETSEGQRLVAHELTHVVQGNKIIKRKPEKPDFRFQSNCNENQECIDTHNMYTDTMLALKFIVFYLKEAYENSTYAKKVKVYDIVTDFLNLIPYIGGLAAAESKRLIEDNTIPIENIYYPIFTSIAKDEDQYNKMKEIQDYTQGILHKLEDKMYAQKVVDTYLSLGNMFLNNTTTGNEIIKFHNRFYFSNVITVTMPFIGTVSSYRIKEEITDEFLLNIYLKGKKKSDCVDFEGSNLAAIKQKDGFYPLSNNSIYEYISDQSNNSNLKAPFDLVPKEEVLTSSELNQFIQFMNEIREKYIKSYTTQNIINEGFAPFDYDKVKICPGEVYESYEIGSLSRIKDEFDDKFKDLSYKKKNLVWSLLEFEIKIYNVHLGKATGECRLRIPPHQSSIGPGR